MILRCGLPNATMMMFDYLRYLFWRGRQWVNTLRSAREKATDRADKLAALRSDPATMCPECDGDGETRVRGMRTTTGYETCVFCGGLGCDATKYNEVMTK